MVFRVFGCMCCCWWWENCWWLLRLLIFRIRGRVRMLLLCCVVVVVIWNWVCWLLKCLLCWCFGVRGVLEECGVSGWLCWNFWIVILMFELIC